MASISNVPREIRPSTPVHDTKLDFGSFNEVPDSHTWAELVDGPPSDPIFQVHESFPVIDLNDPHDIVISRIGHALETWGVFLITGHGVPIGTIDGLESQGNRFFSLPTAEKLRAARKPGDLSGYGQIPIARFFENVMWSEGLTVFESPVNWAPRIWPNDYTEFCDPIEQYRKEMKVLASRIISLVLSSLGISKEDIKWVGPDGDLDWFSTVLQLNWYPLCPNPDRALGMASHTDSLLLTILYPSSTTGLQVLRRHGGQAHWVTVPSVPGSFVIFAADLLQILTNGGIRSPLHRVLVNQAKPRFSAVCFVRPPEDVLIEPLAKLIDPAQGPLFRAVKADEYLQLKMEHYQDALELVKLV